MLLLAVGCRPSAPTPHRTKPPLLMTNRLNEPLLPRKNWLLGNQRAVGLTNLTSFDLAVALSPITPLAELVNRALSDITSSVKEPFVPTVTSPVKLVVTLFKVLV